MIDCIFRLGRASRTAAGPPLPRNCNDLLWRFHQPFRSLRRLHLSGKLTVNDVPRDVTGGAPIRLQAKKRGSNPQIAASLPRMTSPVELSTGFLPAQAIVLRERAVGSLLTRSSDPESGVITTLCRIQSGTRGGAGQECQQQRDALPALRAADTRQRACLAGPRQPVQGCSPVHSA